MTCGQCAKNRASLGCAKAELRRVARKISALREPEQSAAGRHLLLQLSDSKAVVARTREFVADHIRQEHGTSSDEEVTS